MPTKLTQDDIESLKYIVTSGIQPPTFYKSTFTLDRRAALAAKVLDRHGVGVSFDEHEGRIETLGN